MRNPATALALALAVSLVTLACGAQESRPPADARAAAATRAAEPSTREQGTATTATAPASDVAAPTAEPVPPPKTVPAAGELGDLEYRRMTDAINEALPKHKEAFKKLCGGNVEIEIDWPSFGRSRAALESLYGNWGVERLVAGFEGVCHDKAGKEAVLKKVRKIRAVNVKDLKDVKVTIVQGTMTGHLRWGEGAPGMNENEIAASLTKQL